MTWHFSCISLIYGYPHTLHYCIIVEGREISCFLFYMYFVYQQTFLVWCLKCIIVYNVWKPLGMKDLSCLQFPLQPSYKAYGRQLYGITKVRNSIVLNLRGKLVQSRNSIVFFHGGKRKHMSLWVLFKTHAFLNNNMHLYFSVTCICG